MSETEMAWFLPWWILFMAAQSLTFRTCTISIPDSMKIKFKSAHRLMKAVYANEVDYFSEHRQNLKLRQTGQLSDDILAGAPITIEWLHSRNELIQLYICVMLRRILL